MKYTTRLCKIISRSQPAEGFFDFIVYAPDIAENAASGQFANIVTGDKLLRRPISICECDAKEQTLRFVFEVRGEGTKILSQKQVGDTLDVFGPLGKGFTPVKGEKGAVVIGGGIGVPPLLETAKMYAGRVTALLGFRDSKHIILHEDFKRVTENTLLATDDGSAGYHGLVTHLLEERLAADGADVIHACGPIPMLKAIALCAQKYNIPCQVSLEERMGCGIGACLVCACKIKTADGSAYKHVCKDGPVFDSREVDWNV